MTTKMWLAPPGKLMQCKGDLVDDSGNNPIEIPDYGSRGDSQSDTSSEEHESSDSYSFSSRTDN